MKDWAPAFVAIFFGVLFVVLLAFGLRLIFQIKASLTKLEKQLTGLEVKLKANEAATAELRHRLDQDHKDPLMGLVETALGWKNKGPWTTAGLVGAQLFRSYWKSKKSKALPVVKEK